MAKSGKKRKGSRDKTSGKAKAKVKTKVKTKAARTAAGGRAAKPKRGGKPVRNAASKKVAKAPAKTNATKATKNKTAKATKTVASKPTPARAPKAARVNAIAAPKARATKPARPAKPSAVPPGYHSLTPHLVVENGVAAIDFYEQAFGAVEVMRMPGPNGLIAHAELEIEGSRLMLSDMYQDGDARPPTSLGGTTGGVMMYVANVDEVFNKAVTAGCKALMPPADMFWGDRFAKVLDVYGHIWSIATQIEVVSPEEVTRRMEAMAQAPGDVTAA